FAKNSGVRSLCFSPDGRWVAAGTRSGRISVVSVDDRDTAPASWAAHDATVFGLAFLSPSTLVSTGGRTMRLWDRVGENGWKERSAIPTEGLIESLDLNRDTGRIVYGGPIALTVSSLASLLEGGGRLDVVGNFPGHRRVVAFSPDGRNVASVEDQKI